MAEDLLKKALAHSEQIRRQPSLLINDASKLDESLREINRALNVVGRKGRNDFENDLFLERVNAEQVWKQLAQKEDDVLSGLDGSIKGLLERQKRSALNLQFDTKAPKRRRKGKREQKVEEPLVEEEQQSPPPVEGDGEMEEEEPENGAQEDAGKAEGDEDEDDEALMQGGDEDDKIDFAQMEQFLDQADDEDVDERKMMEEEEDEDEGELEDEEGENDEQEVGYADFFGGEGEGDEGREAEDDEMEHGVFEEAREKMLATDDGKDELARRIEALEGEMLKPKPWRLQGEVFAKDRPMNSLLEEPLDFKVTRKMPDPVTREFTETLEAAVKRRILDEEWDDVVRVRLPTEMRENYTDLSEINFEKSQKGLAEVYEDKYKADVLKVVGDKPEDTLKREIEGIFKKLCYNLDVLSNANFVPRLRVEEPAHVSTNVPAIVLEEKIPLAMSARQQKAPQELFDGEKIQIQSGVEMTTEEKRRKRRTVKRNIRTHLKEKLKKKMIKDLEHKGMTKAMYNTMQKSKVVLAKEKSKKPTASIKFTSSSQFFKNLQESREKPVKGKGDGKGPKQAVEAPTKSSKAYKL
eukprot:TRINITY_DN6595_c0_g1_i1.p1 TRINITY_DN6595_c0_g1~~TRINITY_DN6595_c0_g1_i1.p1  ORF type:complete len:580 (+),score=237.56 TRINITY_DN6595_c0_g1_i1:42-1781(+)